jgi:hypothetical protein
MASNFVEFYLQMVDTRLNRPIADSTGKVQVLTVSSPALATVYSDAVGTTATNPLTLTNGAVRFFADVSVTAVDVSVITANGHSAFLSAITPNNHRINIDPDRIGHTAVVAWQVTASGVTADTGMKFPQAVRIKDAFLRVTVPCSGSVLDVGNSTAAASGYIASATVEVTGYRIVDEGSTTLGLRGNTLNNAVTGTLQNIMKYYVPANATSALSIIYAMTTSLTASAGAGGYVYLVYDRLPGA